ncbi:MAG: HPr family phosphocarrier protein [Pseudomonadota bacterium]
MITRTARIQNKLGLHARAASKLVALAQHHAAEISLHREGTQANAKSIMSILMLQATCGTEIEVVANGDDEDAAVSAIVGLIEDLFGEGE